jgi:hypothetical protein
MMAYRELQRMSSDRGVPGGMKKLELGFDNSAYLMEHIH